MQFYNILMLLALIGGSLADDCYKSYDGLTITCKSTFDGKESSTTIKLDTCREKPKISFNIVVDALSIDWDETFEESADVPIPGFSVASFAGVYLKVELTSNTDGTTKLKLGLYVKAIFSLPSVTILDETIATSNCNKFLYWWNSQATGIQAAVGGSGSLLFIILLACCCKCCCCSKSDSQHTTTLVMAPQQPASNTVIVNNSQQQQYTPLPPMGQDPYGVPYKKF